MSRFFSLLEKTLLPVAALISLAASLGDLSGFFRMLPSAQFSFLLLMITLLALGTAGFVQNRCAQIGRALTSLAGKNEMNNINEMIMHIDLNLRKVWGDHYFARMGKLLQMAIEERRVEVNDFSFYFKQLLLAYPGATFLSTSSLSVSHLWTNREVAQALADFIQVGGRVEQLFFVRSLEEESSVEMRVVLAHLKKIGVSVQVIDSAQYPCDLKNFFLVEARRRIAWEIPIDRQGRIGTSVVTADERTIARYVEIFSALWKSNS